MDTICCRCFGERWLCSEHPEETWPHDGCAAPATPCPECNAGEQPEFGPEFVHLNEDANDEEGF
jgi:hypothetical protein